MTEKQHEREKNCPSSNCEGEIFSKQAIIEDFFLNLNYESYTANMQIHLNSEQQAQ